MYRMNILVCFVFDVAFIVKVLSRSMHRIRPILVMQYCLENEKHLPCHLFPVSTEQVTSIASMHDRETNPYLANDRVHRNQCEQDVESHHQNGYVNSCNLPKLDIIYLIFRVIV